MSQQRRSRFVSRFLKRILIAELVIFTASALLCWIIGWRTPYQYGRVLIVSGILSIIVGAMGGLGGGGVSRGTADYQYGKSVGQDEMGQRTQRLMADVAESYAFTIWMTVVGIVAISVGAILRVLFG